MSEKFWYLKRSDLFQQLSDDDIGLVESRSRSRIFPRNVPVYLPADSADSVFLLASGRVKICHLTPDGKQSILAFVDPGELFGELAIFDPGQREEYAETLEKSTVVLIPGDVIQSLMKRHAELSLGITKMIGLRLRRVEQRLKNLLFLSNRERLTHLLLELVEKYGESRQDGVRIGIKLSHQELANVIGSTRETVTVVLGEMQNEGLLSVGRRKIVIHDLDRLSVSVFRETPRIGTSQISSQVSDVRGKARPKIQKSEALGKNIV